MSRTSQSPDHSSASRDSTFTTMFDPQAIETINQAQQHSIFDCMQYTTKRSQEELDMSQSHSQAKSLPRLVLTISIKYVGSDLASLIYLV